MLPVPSRKIVKKAGETLKQPDLSETEYSAAMNILSQWRSLHSYPINTFQAMLRSKVKDYPGAIVAQRLKRTPSIIKKLTRFPEMNLARMQDIGGLRVIVKNVADVYRLHESILQNSRHEAELPPKDYIKHPKADGYRSLHQVFRYKNPKRPELENLRIELQIRTHLQHAWATAVETLGIVEKSSFKTGEGSEEYKRFFRLSSILFAHHEAKTPIDPQQTAQELRELEQHLQIFLKLEGLAVSAKHIEEIGNKQGYHLIVLRTSGQQAKVELYAFAEAQIDMAESIYRALEKDNKDNPDIEIVLTSAGSVKDIKKAYPNYFLDTHKFIGELQSILKAHT